MEVTIPITQREKRMAARDTAVRQVLGMRDDQYVTDRHVAKARHKIRRQEIKAKQSMDVRTMVAHFSEQAEAGREKGTTFRKEAVA